MTTVSAATPTVGADTTDTARLRERCRAALAHMPEDAELLGLLAELAPGDAAAWLATHQDLARASFPASTIASALEVLVERLVVSPDADFAALLLLVADYGDLAPAAAVAAVAAALSPERRATSASTLVSDALARSPAHPALLRVAAEMAAHSGDDAAAHALLTRLGRADDSPGTVSHIFRQRGTLAPSGAPPVRVALLGSYTLDLLTRYVDLELRALGLAPELYVAPFNSWAQEVIGQDSGLHRFEPEIAFLAVSIDDLVPELSGAPDAPALAALGDAAVERVLAVARRFTESSRAPLVVHGFHSAYRDPAGVLQGRSGPSRGGWLAELDARLAAGLAELPRAYLIEMRELIARRTGGASDDPKLRHLAGMRLAPGVVPEVARAYARYVAPLKGLTRKCVVLDLDNTLWGGIVGEDGPHGIRLGNTAPGSEFQELQRYLLSLSARGILLAINSKNNPDDALEVIRAHEGMLLREEAFSAIRMNWQPKPENMRSIAEELGIGLDALVFVDDNPKERELMRQMLPQVLTPELPTDPALYRHAIELLPQLQTLAVTEEDRGRVEQYRARRQREQVRSATGSLDDYLHSLGIAVEIAPATEATLPRLHQLLQRTNQFNLTTRRHDAGALAAWASDPAWRLYMLRARDRFGDHGLVAAAIVQTAGEEWRVESFLMSCRVIGYGVETALLGTIAAEAGAAGAVRLEGEYIQTRKNEPARDFYRRHGFTLTETADGLERWALSLSDAGVAVPAWVSVERHDA